jgi:hypothetical protein
MFSFTGLNPDQTKKLVEEHSVYLTGEPLTFPVLLILIHGRRWLT